MTGSAADGRRTDTWWHTNGDHSVFAAHTHNVFDDSGRVTRSWTSRDSSNAASKRVIDQSYSYAKSGKDTGLVQSITTHLPSRNITTTLGYDSSNRLTKATNWNGKDYRYTYDVNGNRKTVKVDGKTTQSLTFDTDNQISSSGYSYDEAGRRTKDPHGGTLTWNSAGQMVKQVKGSDTAKFVYSGSGQDELVQQEVNGSATNYIYGHSNQAGIPTVVRFTQPGASPEATFNNDAAGQPIDFSQGGTDYFLVYNGLGRFIATVLPTGQQNGGNLKYDPYGAFQQATDGSSSTSGAKAPGKQARGVSPVTGAAAKAAAQGSQSPWTTIGIADQLMPLAGWWKRGARWNDTATGTWTSADPITTLNDPGRANPYAYAGDDPVNAMDPTGRIDWTEIGVGALDILAGGADIGVGSLTCYLSLIGVVTAIVGCGVGFLIVAAGVGEIALGTYEIWQGATG